MFDMTVYIYLETFVSYLVISILDKSYVYYLLLLKTFKVRVTDKILPSVPSYLPSDATYLNLDVIKTIRLSILSDMMIKFFSE